MRLFFDEAEFDAQLQRTASKVLSRAADLGEVFAVAARITPGDYASWYREWFAAGDRNLELADGEAAKGHHVTAADAYLRAGECYRSAYFFTRRDPGGAVLQRAWNANRAAFAAAAHLDPLAEQVRIPWEGIELEGYLWRCGVEGAPLVFWPLGYDEPLEEAYTLGVVEATRRGFDSLTFSGPGQAEVLYTHGIGFRHDYESVVSPVIDWAEGRSDLDTSRLAIVGRSFGGYLAPRAAAADPRIKALAADPAQTDMGALFRARLAPELLALLDQGEDEAFDEAWWTANPGIRGEEYWMSRLRSHGLSRPAEYVREMDRWAVDVEAIECPTLVSYGEGDFAQSGARAFFDRLRVDDKRFVMFAEIDGSGGHCEGMGPTRYYATLFSFLEDVFSR